MFDTHCHLNFKRLSENLDQVITEAKKAGVTHFVVPGTDMESSRKAMSISEQYPNIYSAVGIHPHHVFEIQMKDEKGRSKNSTVNSLLEELELLLVSSEVKKARIVAIGEIGLDRHAYTNTKYENYAIGEEFIILQKQLFVSQLELAKKYKKSVIIHSRETTDEILEILKNNWDGYFENNMVFHCCEPEQKMLDFATQHSVFIGVDGDVTYFSEKQEFIKQVPLERLVVETDAPFLLPEPLKSQKEYPNAPANMPLIVDFVSKLKGFEADEVARVTLENGKRLFGID